MGVCITSLSREVVSLWMKVCLVITMVIVGSVSDDKECGPPPVYSPKQSWHPLDCSEKRVPGGTVCATVCRDSYPLGPGEITCRGGEWNNSWGIKQYTVCVDLKTLTEEFRHSLLEIVKENSYWGVLFAVDVTSKNPELYFKFINALLKRAVAEIVAVPGKTAGLVAFADKAKKLVGVRENNPCEFWGVLDRDKEEGSASNYLQAMEEVAEQIASLPRKAVIVFIASSQDSGVEQVWLERAKQLRAAGHVIIAVGMESAKRPALAAMASVGLGNNLLVFGLRAFTDLHAVAESFDRPCKGLVRSRNLIWIPASCTRPAVEDGYPCHAICKVSPIIGPGQIRCEGGVWMSMQGPNTCGEVPYCPEDPPPTDGVAGVGLPSFTHSHAVTKPAVYPDEWLPPKPPPRSMNVTAPTDKEGQASLRNTPFEPLIPPGARIPKGQDVDVDKVVPIRQNWEPPSHSSKQNNGRWGSSDSLDRDRKSDRGRYGEDSGGSNGGGRGPNYSSSGGAGNSGRERNDYKDSANNRGTGSGGVDSGSGNSGRERNDYKDSGNNRGTGSGGVDSSSGNSGRERNDYKDSGNNRGTGSGRVDSGSGNSGRERNDYKDSGNNRGTGSGRVDSGSGNSGRERNDYKDSGNNRGTGSGGVDSGSGNSGRERNDYKDSGNNRGTGSGGVDSSSGNSGRERNDYKDSGNNRGTGSGGVDSGSGNSGRERNDYKDSGNNRGTGSGGVDSGSGNSGRERDDYKDSGNNRGTGSGGVDSGNSGRGKIDDKNDRATGSGISSGGGGGGGNDYGKTHGTSEYGRSNRSGSSGTGDGSGNVRKKERKCIVDDEDGEGTNDNSLDGGSGSSGGRNGSGNNGGEGGNNDGGRNNANGDSGKSDSSSSGGSGDNSNIGSGNSNNKNEPRKSGDSSPNYSGSGGSSDGASDNKGSTGGDGRGSGGGGGSSGGDNFRNGRGSSDTGSVGGSGWGTGGGRKGRNREGGDCSDNCQKAKLDREYPTPKSYTFNITEKLNADFSRVLADSSYSSVMFLVQEHVTSAIRNYDNVKKFVESILSAYPLRHPGRTASLFSFSSNPNEVLTSEGHACYFYEQLMALESVSSMKTNLAKVLQAAENYIRKAKEKTVIILVTHQKDDGPPTRLGAANRLKELGVVMYVLAIYDFNLQQLVEIASVGPDGKRLLYPLPNYEMLRSVANDMKKNYRKETLTKCSPKEPTT